MFPSAGLKKEEERNVQIWEKRSLKSPETNNNSNKRRERRFTFTNTLKKEICGSRIGIE